MWRADTHNRAKPPFDPVEIIQHIAAFLVSQTSDASNTMAVPHTGHHPLAIQSLVNDAPIVGLAPLSPPQLSISNLFPNTPTPQDVILATHTRSSYADRTLNSPSSHTSAFVSLNRPDAATYHFSSSSPQILQDSPLYEPGPSLRPSSPLLVQETTHDNHRELYHDKSSGEDSA